MATSAAALLRPRPPVPASV
ncbi:hypothetical protein HU200_032610 [Digitaria exilis]|uniref:Uncharacterized protein n=1 Tax=Digitaria exilis TaxID=1010633 RepID=A0A835ES18_9POAL|nr:hypothetical protein HU200_032610 [Digitaria exilis]